MDGRILSRDDFDANDNGTQNLHSCFLNKFAMISAHSGCVMWPNYPGSNVVRAASKLRKIKKKLVIMRSCSLCFAEDDKEMYESL